MSEAEAERLLAEIREIMEEDRELVFGQAVNVYISRHHPETTIDRQTGTC